MTPHLRTAVFFLLAGTVATAVAAACSLLADGPVAKRWTWLAVGLTVAAGAGGWRASRVQPGERHP